MANFESIRPYTNMLDDETRKSFVMDLGSVMSPEQAAALDKKIADDEMKRKVAAAQGLALKNGQLVLNSAGPNPFDLLMPGKDEKKLSAQIVAASKSALANQSAGVNQLQEQIREAAAKPREINWGPLASYFDSIVEGSKLSQGYKAPETQTEKDQRLLGMQVQLQKAKEGMSDKEIDFLKSQLASKQGDRTSRFQFAQAKAMEKDIGENLSKLNDSLADEEQRFGMLDESLASGDWQKISGSLSNFSRLMGEKGVLTDEDIKRVIPTSFQGDVAKFLSYMGSTPTTDIPQEYTKSMLETLSLAKQKIAEKTITDLGNRELRWNNPASTYYGVYSSVGKPQLEALRNRATQIKQTGISGLGQPKTPPAKPSVGGGGKKNVNEMTAEEIKAELGL